MSRPITPRTSIDNLRQEAKRWLKALRAGDPEARGRFERAASPVPPAPTLRHVQHALARELGFQGWSELRTELVRLRAGDAGSDQSSRPTVAGYDAMAHRLLDAYRTGTPEAMERHYADTWHRRAWGAMRSYVLADLGIHHTADQPFPDITLDHARLWIAQESRFHTWDELVEYVSNLPPDRREVTRVPVGAARDESDDAERFEARDWDSVIEAIIERGLTVVQANGQMTDAVLERIARIPHVTALGLDSCRGVTDAGMAAVAGMTQLRHLDIAGTGVTDEGIRALAGLPGLESFKGDFLKVTDTGIGRLASCPRLTRLNLIWTQTGDGVIRAFAGHASLRQFITGVEVTDAGLRAVSDIPHYRRWTEPIASDGQGDLGPTSLDLRGTFGDDGLAALAALEGLCSLHFESRSPALSAQGLIPLAAMPHLVALNGDFHDEALAILSTFPALRRLGCQDTDATDDGWVALSRSRTIERIWGRRCHGLRARGFRALGTMPALEDLAVSCRNVDDAAIATLPTFPALRAIMPMDIPDAGYRHIGRCERLERLTLMYCRDTGDEATEQITGLASLKRYFASYNRITDRTPALLATLPALAEVEFSAVSRLTNAGIAALSESRSLRRLSVGGSPGVTPEVKAAFSPSVRVRIE